MVQSIDARAREVLATALIQFTDLVEELARPEPQTEELRTWAAEECLRIRWNLTEWDLADLLEPLPEWQALMRDSLDLLNRLTLTPGGAIKTSSRCRACP